MVSKTLLFLSELFVNDEVPVRSLRNDASAFIVALFFDDLRDDEETLSPDLVRRTPRTLVLVLVMPLLSLSPDFVRLGLVRRGDFPLCCCEEEECDLLASALLLGMVRSILTAAY